MDYVAALRREWGTHLHADDAGWTFPVTYGDALTAVLTSGYLAVHRDPKMPKPELPFPWDHGPVTFTPEEIAAAEAVLEQRVKFAD